MDHAVAEAIESAKKDMGEAGLGWSNGICNVNVNCDIETSCGWWIGNNPDAYSNHQMTVLRVTTPGGALKGLFVSFGMKPAVIDNAGRAGNQRLVSAEVAGFFCRKMEENYRVPVIYAVSAGGNQMPRKTALRSSVTNEGAVIEQDLGVVQGLAYAREQGDEVCKYAYEAKREETIAAYRKARAEGSELPQLAPQWVLDMMAEN